MKVTPSWRTCADCLTGKNLIAVAVLTGLVITAAVAAATGDPLAYLTGRTILIAQESGSCSPSESEILKNWDKCARVTCSSGNWTCTEYKDGTSGSTSGSSGCSGSPPTSSSWCENGAWKESSGSSDTSGATGCWTCGSCDGMPDGESKNYCKSGCKSSCDGSSGGTSGSTGVSGTGGGYVDPNSGKTAKQMCWDSLVTITDADMKSRMEQTCKCNTPPIDASCSTNSALPGDTGVISGERCFFPAKWKKPSGEVFGGSLTCRSDKTDCRETEAGPVIASGDIAEFTGGPTSCYKPSGGGGSTGSYPAAGGNCGPDSAFGRETQGIMGSDQRYKDAEKKYGCGSGWSGGGQGYTSDGPREMWISQCVSSRGKSRPECESLCGTSSDCPKSGSFSYWSESKKKWFSLTGAGDCDGLVSRNEIPGNEAEWCRMATGGGGVGNYGSGQGNTSGAQMPCTFPSGTVLYCRTPNVDCSRNPGGPILSSQEVGATGPNCTFGGGSQWGQNGGVDQCVSRCMASYSTDSDYYAKCKADCHGIGGGDRGNGDGQWANPQLQDIEQRLTEMKAIAEKMASPNLQAIITSITQAISAVRNGTTPEQTRTDGIYELMNKFWRTAESLRGNDGGQNDGYGYMYQCDMIRKKMEYADGNNGSAAQLKDMYSQCIKQAQGAVTGSGFNEEQFTDIQDQFDAFGQQDYAQNACAMVDSLINEARNAIENEAPMMIKKLGKKADAAAKLKKLLGMAKDILNRAHDYRQNNDCGKALTAMRDMEQLGQEADRIMSQAGVRMGGQDLALVDYEQQYDNVTDRVGEKLGKTTNIDMKELRRHMEKSGYKGAELAAIETLASNPDVLENLLTFAGNSRIVEAAVNADISTVKLESIIAENSALLQKVADLELENKNLKTGVRGIVEQMKNSTYNPRIAPKMAALLEVASSLPEKEFKAKYEQYVQESNDENYKTGIDPFRDVHTFEKGHEWFIAAVKNGIESGLFKGKGDGTFDPTGPVLRQDMSIVIARDQEVADKQGTPESSFAQKASTYARESLAGLEGLGVEFSDVFNGAPTEAATRLEVARMIAAVYADSLSKADLSVLDEYADLKDLSEEDRFAVALVISNSIMMGTDGTFDPNGTFNRAQFATVMGRMAESDDAEDVVNDKEETDGTAAAKNAIHSATETGEKPLSEPVLEPEPKRAPDFISDQISEQQLQMLTALTASFIAQNGKVGVTREQALRVSLMTDISKSLASTQEYKFDHWRKQENMPDEWIAKQTVDLKNMMTSKALTMLRDEIVPASGFLMK
ncbi:MAG: S-layer homology domain-containing protein [Candidatus Peregrinibacteria bacterium]|nr:S-layer homology domain-containing protein [Candidatus Peregrinibacteria bacterium]